MCNTKCCNDGCHEEDIMCCAPLMHCCGGYSEHNNCCPHDRCCNQCCGCHGHIPCCGGCCNKCNCICPCIKKAIKDTKDELDKNINTLESRVIRDEDQHEQDILNLTNELGELNDNLEKEIADRIQDVDEEEVRAKAAEDALNNKVDTRLIASAEYNNTDTKIYFRNIDGGVLSTIDASVFVKDGMVESASVITKDGVKYLHIVFNGDAGKVPVDVPVRDIFDANLYYTKTEVDAKEAVLNNSKADKATTLAGYGITNAYTKTETDALLDGKQNVINDLSTIRSGAAAGVTALQPGDAFDGASKSGNTITFTKNGGSPFTFTLPDISDAGSQTINVGGTQVTIEQAINNLANQISNLGTQITTLQNSILWQIDQTDSTKIVAKNNRGAIAAGFFDSTVS